MEGSPTIATDCLPRPSGKLPSRSFHVAQCCGRYLLLAMLWGLIVMIPASFWIASRWAMPAPGLTKWVEWMTGSILECTSLLRPVVLLGAALLGGLHYLFCGSLPFEKRAPIRTVERWVVAGACVLLSMGAALHLRKWFRCREALQICFEYSTGLEMSEMDQRKDYPAMVARMEEACVSFQDAKLELGKRFHPRSSGGNGISYLFTTLVAWYPEPYELNMPQGLLSYLTFYDCEAGKGMMLERSEPLAREMARSRVPIIRLTGLWWLGQRGAFVKEANMLVEGGDLSFQSWKDIRGD